MIEWELIKELVLKGIFKGVRALESFTFLDIPDEVLFSVARTVATAERRNIRMNWLDDMLGDICLRRDRLILSKKEEELKTRLAELLGEAKVVEQQLGEVRAEMSAKGFPSGSSDNNKIYIFSLNFLGL